MNDMNTLNNTTNNEYSVSELKDDVVDIKESVAYLKDLFVRRLNDDKQKALLIQQLNDRATFAYIEPFLYDIILLLDRIETAQDDFSKSIGEELYGIVSRRGLEKINVGEVFDPTIHKAVKVREEHGIDTMRVSGVIRNGYVFGGKVIRPVEVEVIKPIL